MSGAEAGLVPLASNRVSTRTRTGDKTRSHNNGTPRRSSRNRTRSPARKTNKVSKAAIGMPMLLAASDDFDDLDDEDDDDDDDDGGYHGPGVVEFDDMGFASAVSSEASLARHGDDDADDFEVVPQTKQASPVVAAAKEKKGKGKGKGKMKKKKRKTDRGDGDLESRQPRPKKAVLDDDPVVPPLAPPRAPKHPGRHRRGAA